MIMFALHWNSALLARLRNSRWIGVSVLAEEQDRVVLLCATKGTDKMRRVSWEVDHGVPRIRHRPPDGVMCVHQQAAPLSIVDGLLSMCASSVGE